MTRSAQAQAVQEAVLALDHPTADEIFMQVRNHEEKVSIGTIYRNLERLVAEGRLRVRQVGGQRRYDTNTEAHAHFHCTRCDRLIDVAWNDDELDGMRSEAERQGFIVEDHLLEVQGACAQCIEAAPPRAKTQDSENPWPRPVPRPPQATTPRG